jgi:hypothetical protein
MAGAESPTLPAPLFLSFRKCLAGIGLEKTEPGFPNLVGYWNCPQDWNALMGIHSLQAGNGKRLSPREDEAAYPAQPERILFEQWHI